MRKFRAGVAGVLVMFTVMLSAGPASAVSGSITCTQPSFAFTQSSGAGTHNHRQDFAGVARFNSYYTETIERRTWGNNVRVLTYWSVLVTAITASNNGAICTR